MAKTTTRVFALVGVILFLFSSLAATGAVLYTMFKDNKDDGTVQQTGSNQNNPVKVEEDTKLAGKKLSNFTPITKADQLSAQDIVPGTGEEVKPGARVTVHYTGAYAVNGEIFESSRDSGQTVSFGLNEVIQGWTQGVPGMKAGGTRRLIIPGNLAYGEAPEGYMPGSGGRPLGVLVFDIEVTAVQNP